MESSSLEEICCLTCKEVEATANFIKEHIGKINNAQVEHKSFNSLVSFVDKTAEDLLKQSLIKIVPGSGFIAEESEETGCDADYKWIIDPLDGTTNFLHQLPFFAISVALAYKDELIVGVVFDIVHNDSFYAWKGGGSYLNGRKISVSQNDKLGDCLVATGFPYYDFTWMDSYLRCFRHFMHTTRGVRRIGSAALDLAYVACGRFDFYFEYSLQKWDMAAGILLVTEAGGKITDLKGNNNFLNNGSIIASSDMIFSKVLEVIKPEFSNYT